MVEILFYDYINTNIVIFEDIFAMIKDLTYGKPAKVILTFSIPIILGNLFQQIYNLVDMVIVGRFLGFQALAGVGATGGMSFLVLGFALGITGGFGIMVAQFYGAKDFDRMRQSIGTSLILCVILSALLTAVTLGWLKPMLNLIDTPESIFHYSYDYIFIIYAGIFANVAYNMVACILRALGDSRIPLYFLLFSSVLNVGLDLVCIIVFGWGVRGAAAATVFSQMVSAVLCFIYSWKKYPEIRLGLSDFRTDISFMWDHLKIGLPMALQFSITAIGVIILQGALNQFEDTYIAGFSAANRVQQLSSTIGVSFGVAIANYAGQNFGAGEIGRVKKGVNATIFLSLGVCALASVFMSIFADWLTTLFLSTETLNGPADILDQIYGASRQYLYISAIFFPFLYVLFVYRNALQGIGKTFWPLMAGVAELLIRLVASAVLPPRLGFTGVPLVDVSAWVGACVILAVSYYIIIPKE